MATKKKMLQAAAGNAGGAAGGLNVEDVFSTYLYTGTGSALTITNDIDLAGEGGLVWIKNRENQYQDHSLFDTTRPPSYVLYTNTTSASALSASRFSSFNSDGFTVGTDTSTNESGKGIASWTFRKAPKFFDVVTYTGNGVAGRTISHNLGATVGAIVVKGTSGEGRDWTVFHRSIDATAPEDYYIPLNYSDSSFNFAMWDDTAPTSSEFTVGSSNFVNGNGDTYVAYLFAHNDGDGEFGPDGDADIIKCGSYTGTGAAGNFIDLGFEPQWVLYKRTDSTGSWVLQDNMRGMDHTSYDLLYANTSGAEVSGTAAAGAKADPRGFTVDLTGGDHNSSGGTYIYIAIRRGTKVPESATEVFAMDDRSGGPPNAVSGFPVDMAIFTNKTATDNKYTGARLIQGKRLYTNLTSGEGSDSELAFDYNTGFIDRSDTSTDHIHWMWKRAPGFFDVVAYTGNSTAGRTVSHNLGVAPEMIWVKARDRNDAWSVYHADLGPTLHLSLEAADAAETGINYWYNTSPTDSVFTLGTEYKVNRTPHNYIAYLFASLPGISKVGSYTGTGGNTSPVVDCGFSSGPRLLIIKRIEAGGPWYIWDTERGLVAGNDAGLLLNETSAEFSADQVDPTSSGFQLSTGNSNLNENGEKYIFYAIA